MRAKQLIIGCAAVLAFAACSKRTPAPAAGPQTIRCAVIGGMTETGFWPALVAPFEQQTGHKVEIVATGPKDVVVGAFRKGGIDLLTLHASDAIVNVVADRLAVDPQPWLRNDLVVVGPAADPAGIRGEPDAAAAMQKIIAAKSPVLVHATNGADTVLHDLLDGAHLALADGEAIAYGGDRPQELLGRAAELGAYTLVGRIPFLAGKVPHHGLELMVRGDRRLRRPYLVVVAAGPAGDPRLAAARALVTYLRSPSTQAWIAGFGKGRYDDAPLFFPVAD